MNRRGNIDFEPRGTLSSRQRNIAINLNYGRLKNFMLAYWLCLIDLNLDKINKGAGTNSKTLVFHPSKNVSI